MRPVVLLALVASSETDPDRSRDLVEQEKSALRTMLQEQMGLTLSPEKTLVTPVTSTMRFLGHHLRVRPRPSTRLLAPRLVIPKERSVRLRRNIADIFDGCGSDKNRGVLRLPVVGSTDDGDCMEARHEDYCASAA